MGVAWLGDAALGLMGRLVASNLKVLDCQRAVMRRHFLVMLSRDRIGRGFGAALEHLGFFLQDFGLWHGSFYVSQLRQAR
jgi:hypothetical protein